MATIKIINPGLFSTIQDNGRAGYQQYGMPVSGAMDTYSMKLANYLVGNPLNEACIEATLIGPEIEILENVTIGICGARVKVLLNEKEVDSNQSIQCKKDDYLSFETITEGSRIYLAFGGGIDVPKVMGSKSTYFRARIGGLNGRNLVAGDELSVNNQNVKAVSRQIAPDLLLPLSTIAEIRVIAGTEIHAFSMNALSTFLTSTYEISPESDRMGFRLSGAKIGHRYGPDILSSGISKGAIQVPGHGQPIIMMADHQTVGGYTKIANAISVDIPILGQMKPGNMLKFKEIRLNEAHALLHSQNDRLRRFGIV